MLTSESKPDQPAIYGLAVLQMVSWGTCFYVFGLILLPVERELGLSRSVAALAFPLALLFEGLCSIAVGKWIAKRLGSYVMTGGSLLAGTGLLVLSQATSQVQFYIAWALIGVSFACTLYTPLFSLIVLEYPTVYRNRITVISLITGFASTLFLPGGGWLLVEFGWRNCVLAYAMLNICCCAPGHWFAVKAVERSVVHAARGTINAQVSLHAQNNTANTKRLEMAIYIRLTIFSSAIGALSATVAAHLIPMLTERGISLEFALLAPAAIGALQTFARLPLLYSGIGTKIHQLNFALILLFPLSIVLLQTAGTSGILLIAFVTLYGIAHGGWTIVRAIAVPQYLGPSNAAIRSGKIAFWATLGRIALPTLIAFVWTSTQGYQLGYWILLVVATLGFAAYASAQMIYLNSQAAQQTPE